MKAIAGLNFFCKILMNSLYGKFGQRSYQWEKTDNEYGIDNGYFNTDSGLVSVRTRLGYREVKVARGEAYHSMPAIAAHITGVGRMMLWEYIDLD